MVMRNEYRPYAQVDSRLRRRVKNEARDADELESTVLGRALQEYFERKAKEQDD